MTAMTESHPVDNLHPTDIRGKTLEALKTDLSTKLDDQPSTTKSCGILFGSQTGAAEALATELFDKLSDEGILCTLGDLEHFEICKLENMAFMVIIISTYGEGEPPDGSIRFVNLIDHICDSVKPKLFNSKVTVESDLGLTGSKSSPSCIQKTMNENLFYGKNCTVFALGSSQYKFFAQTGKDIFEKLASMGACMFYPLGIGNDDVDLDADFSDWVSGKHKGILLNSATVSISDVIQRSNTESHIEDGHPVSKDAFNDWRIHRDTVSLGKLHAFRGSSSISLNKNINKMSLPYDASVLGGGSCSISKFYFNSHRVCITDVIPLVYNLDDVFESHAAETIKISDTYSSLPDYGSSLTSRTDVIEVQIPLKKYPHLAYCTGDCVHILPRNSDADIKSVAERFSLDTELMKSTYVSFTKSDYARSEGVHVVRKPFPTPISLYEIVALYCDLRGPMTKSFSNDMFSRYGIDSHGQALVKDPLKISSKVRGNDSMSPIEFICNDFRNSAISIDDFVLACPRSRARVFSVASSSLEQPRKISLCVRVFRGMNGIIGTTSRFFLDISSENPTNISGTETDKPKNSTHQPLIKSSYPKDISGMCYISIRKGLFRLPLEKKPLVMICAGTGIAPMRACIRELIYSYRHTVSGPNLSDPANIHQGNYSKGWRNSHVINSVTPNILVLFGCRDSSHWLYKDDIYKACEVIPGFNCDVAFSRQSACASAVAPVRKRTLYNENFEREIVDTHITLHYSSYIQVALEQQHRKLDVLNMVEKGGYIFICGSKMMTNSIRNILSDILNEEYDSLVRNGRILWESWG